MKVNNWLVFFLVSVGVSVGIISLYMASLSGVMGKMGILGGDFSQSIDVNELARQLISQKQTVDCSLWNVSKHVPNYLFSKDIERIELSGELGGQRIACGVKHVKNGNVERGVYTIIKGLYYLKSHYTEMRSLIQADRNQCGLFKNLEYERWVEGYLNATQGRIHDVVFDIYKQVENARAGVEELCLD